VRVLVDDSREKEEKSLAAGAVAEGEEEKARRKGSGRRRNPHSPVSASTEGLKKVHTSCVEKKGKKEN